MKTSSFALLGLLLSLQLVKQVSAASMYQCYHEGNQYINSFPLDISYDCCYGTMMMYDRNSQALETELEECANSVFNDMMMNMNKHCDSMFTHCTLDYHDFTCDNVFAENCKDAGGILIESDLRIECNLGGKITLDFKNKIDCLSSSCTEDELFTVMKQATSAFDSSCEVSKVDGVKVDGVQSSYSETGSGNDDISTGAIIGIVVACAVVAIALIGIIVYFMGKKFARSEIPDEPGVAEKDKDSVPEPSATRMSEEAIAA